MSNPRLPLGPDSLATLSSWLETGGQVWRHRPLPSPAHSVLMAHFHQAIFWLQFGFPCNHSGARNWASWTNNTPFPSARQRHSGHAKRRTRPWIMMTLQRCSQWGLSWARFSSPSPALRTRRSSGSPVLSPHPLPVHTRKLEKWLCE